MQTVLVTGATGFTGGHLARFLVQKGFRVRALVRRGKDTSALALAGIEIATGDLTDRNSLDAAMSGVDTVYHIAALYREEGVSKQRFWDVNVTGTKNLIEAAGKAGVLRFVHCSTVGVQGEIQNPPATEEAPYRPGDHYQQSKMEGELLALDYFKKGHPVVVFRPVGIYGPGDTRFLKLFRNVKKPMIGSGKALYHLTYIDDLVEGILKVGMTPGIEGEIFTLAGPRYTTLNELYDVIAGVLGVKRSNISIPVWPVWTTGALCELLCRPFRIEPPIFRRRVDFFIKDRAFDITKARTRLEYDPKMNLNEGVRRTAEWYKDKGLID
jgi:nucleoside-diphosphate-sugar epimerase